MTPENIKSANYLGKCFGLVGKIQFFSGEALLHGIYKARLCDVVCYCVHVLMLVNVLLFVTHKPYFLLYPYPVHIIIPFSLSHFHEAHLYPQQLLQCVMDTENSLC